MKKIVAVFTFLGVLLLGTLVATPASAAQVEQTAITASAPAATNLVEAIQKPAAIAAEATPNSVQIDRAAKIGPVKTAICYNRMSIKWWWGPACVNWGYGIPASCWYIETVCY